MEQEEIIKRFESWIQKQHHYTPATRQNYMQGIKRVDLGNLHESLEQLKQNAATKTYNLTIVALHHLARVISDPVLKEELENLKKLKHENVKHHLPYTKDQMRMILAAATGWKHQALSIAFYTGLRKSEIQQLNIQDIDWENQNLRVVGKGGKVRFVPIVNIESFTRWKKIRDLKGITGDHWLFTSVGSRPSLQSGGVFVSISKKVGFQVKLHSCRKTYALAMYRASGYNLRLVQLLLGHASIQTTQIYLNISESEMMSQVKKIGRIY